MKFLMDQILRKESNCVYKLNHGSQQFSRVNTYLYY